MAVIQGVGFHAQRGESIKRGDLCEALVLAALHYVFSPRGWQIEPQFAYPNEALPLHDVFDFFTYKPGNSEVADAIAIQVTSYKEGPSVKEEPNKTYEFFETLEEFTYFLTRARVIGLPNLPLNTKSCHVLFGNKRYVRKWVLTHQESVFDLCVYPHYDDEENYASQPLYPRLKAIARGNADLYEIAKRIIDLNDKKKLHLTVATQLEGMIRRFGGYAKNGFPLNPGAQLVLTARRDFLNSEEHMKNRTFLQLQLKDGPPAQRIHIKREFMQPTNATTGQWQRALEHVRSAIGRKRPEFVFGKNVLENYSAFTHEFSNNLARDREEYLTALWNSSDLGRRRFMRMILIQLSGKRAEDFYTNAINEQNLSSEILHGNTTRSVISMISSGINERAHSLSDSKRIQAYLESMKSQVAALVSYIGANGTTNRPVAEFLQYLADEAVQNGDIPEASRSSEGFCSYLVDYVYETRDRLRTFPDHAVHGLGHACTFHAEMTFRKVDGTVIFVKSKPTDSEERRRAKEEGQKAWLGKLHYDREHKQLKVNSSKQFWILLDGNWSNVAVMEQLVECGWRVYFDAFRLIEDLSDALR